MLAPAPDWYSTTTTTKKKPPYTQADIDASLAANPYASTGAYMGPPIDWNGVAAGKITIPGADPDYKSLIAGDPNLVQGGAELDQSLAGLDTARRAAIRQAVIRSGFTPASVTGDIDEATRQAAEQNQFSTKAELDRSKLRSSTDLQSQLAARGILASGALAGGSSRIQEGYERGTTTGLNSLLDAISGVENQTAQQRFQITQQRQQLREQAAMRIAQDPRYQPLQPSDAVLDPASGLYVTPDGRWYTANGQPASAPVQASPAPAPTYTPAPAPIAPVAATTAGGRAARDDIYAGY